MVAAERRQMPQRVIVEQKTVRGGSRYAVANMMIFQQEHALAWDVFLVVHSLLFFSLSTRPGRCGDE
jgi:hypothetical protein